MLRTNKQRIEEGDGNIQSNGDVQVTYNYFSDYQPSVIRFYEGDICEVLEKFNSYLEEDNGNSSGLQVDEFEVVDKPEKNRLNNLSVEYFQMICEEYLTYFRKIDVFLKAPQNKKYLAMYRKTAAQLKFRIGVIRKKFVYFEDVLESILMDVIGNKESSIVTNIDLFIVFINYMYWNCDIGKRK